ncbi:MAG: heme exporter protein D [Arenicella sp.]|jgi:heme exporter protein D
MDWSEFFYMGGYAFEVWTSWGLTLLVLFAFVIIPKRRNAKIRSEIKRQVSREQRDANG